MTTVGTALIRALAPVTRTGIAPGRYAQYLMIRRVIARAASEPKRAL